MSVSVDTLCHSVEDSPQQPELKFENLNVMEEHLVNLNCSAEAPCPKQLPTISWSNITKSANITTHLLEKPNKIQSAISFKASYRDHKKIIYCIVTYTRNTSNDSTVETNVTLKVEFPPKETRITISPSASVSVGTNVTLTCRSKGSPSRNMTYTWYKRGENRPVAQRKHFTFIVTQNNTGWYFCTAQNKHGNQSSQEIQLTVGGSIPMIPIACVGGIVAVLMLSIFLYTRIMKKTNREDGVGEKYSFIQAHNGTVDSTYAEVLTVTKQDNTISDVQSFCKNDHNTEEDSAEDEHEQGSDVVYTQVNVLLKNTQPINVQCESIYAQVKI
ncbi:B-cell receptor CD22 [Danio aesculapii]|uniref:B-cell receptor CD22 n=1 Tax=Danio aesculapii TaxID=1142201 RepID=UPI0024BF6E0F|nr:B-cell receptor CD22 [Danio aesculapii]